MNSNELFEKLAHFANNPQNDFDKDLLVCLQFFDQVPTTHLAYLIKIRTEYASFFERTTFTKDQLRYAYEAGVINDRNKNIFSDSIEAYNTLADIIAPYASKDIIDEIAITKPDDNF